MQINWHWFDIKVLSPTTDISWKHEHWKPWNCSSVLLVTGHFTKKPESSYKICTTTTFTAESHSAETWKQYQPKQCVTGQNFEVKLGKLQAQLHATGMESPETPWSANLLPESNPLCVCWYLLRRCSPLVMGGYLQKTGGGYHLSRDHKRKQNDCLNLLYGKFN